MATKGKFIVLDGTDGVGKATQTVLLAGRLMKEGFSVATVEFPQYGTRSAAMVEDYLAGKYGRADEVNPHVASTFYACDRCDAAPRISAALLEGKVVIANRYTASNMGHQGGKLENIEEKKKFWDWIRHFEFDILKIPKPDVTLVLHVPAEVAQRSAQKRGHQEYLLVQKKHDIHESHVEHLKQAEESYLELARTFPEDFKVIPCYENGALLEPDVITEKIVKALEPIIFES